jgi:hypothetical protein
LEDSSSIHVTTGAWWLPDSTPGGSFILQPDIPLEDDNLADFGYFILAVEYFKQMP